MAYAMNRTGSASALSGGSNQTILGTTRNICAVAGIGFITRGRGPDPRAPGLPMLWCPRDPEVKQRQAPVPFLRRARNRGIARTVRSKARSGALEEFQDAAKNGSCVVFAAT